MREELVIRTHGFDNFLGQGANPGILAHASNTSSAAVPDDLSVHN